MFGKNWKTTLLGAIAGLTQVAGALYSGGIHIGHWGATDFTQLVAGIGTLLLGAYAKDHNVTGGTDRQ